MEAELSILFNDVRILQMERMFQLAATIVVLYDHIICSQKEVSFGVSPRPGIIHIVPEKVDSIWRRSKSLVSYLYLTNRYVGDVISILSAILFL
ncbi:uncharacterized protein EDB91DRAFT_1095715, partial [Suillus paluster]|uniref:uncharacterized protein n=1 Tax=Suillus paluster TaxID=48578 RepID=UPI001B860796